MLNGHGDDIHNYTKIRYNFSSNVYYKGCNQRLLDKLHESLPGSIQNYPSPTAAELSFRATTEFGLKAENYLFFNGATEAFYTIAHLFKGKNAIVYGPTFSEYEDACSIHGLEIERVARTKFLSDKTKAHLGFLCNPNNPDGSVVSVDEITFYLTQNQDSVLVVDEAYIDFTSEAESVIHLTERHPNLIVVRSMTKTFGIPGLRLGFVIANSHLINKLTSLKMPWSVNAMAIQAGLFIFDHYKDLRFSIDELLQEMGDLIERLNEIDFLALNPTNTSYVLAHLKKGTATDLKEYLAVKHGILIRNANNFRGIEGEAVRIAVQSPEANRELIKALKQWNP